MDLEKAMLGRVRRHMITSLGGIVLAIALMAVTGAGSHAIFGASMPVWARMLPILGIVLIPTIGLTSTFRNLRCPSCNGLVALQVSTQYSLFSRMASKNCRHCGAKIFGDELAGRFRRMLVIMVVLGLSLGFGGAILTMMFRH
jgi:hypothetical protein